MKKPADFILKVKGLSPLTVGDLKQYYRKTGMV